MQTAKELALITLVAVVALVVVSITSAMIRVDRAQPFPTYNNDNELNWAHRIVRGLGEEQ